VKIDDGLHCHAVLLLLLRLLPPRGCACAPARENTCATMTGRIAAAATARDAAFACCARTPRLFILGALGICGAQSRPAGRSRTFPTLRGHSG